MATNNSDVEVKSCSICLQPLIHSVDVIILVLALISIGTSTLSLVVILKSSKMRNRYFVTMIAIHMNDLFTGICYTIITIMNLLRKDKEQLEITYSCCCQSAILSFCNNNALLSAIALTVDRTVAVYQPLYYRNVSVLKLHVPLLFICNCYSLSLSIVITLQGYGKPIPANRCGPEPCWNSERLVQAFQSLHMFLSFAMLFLNVCVMAYSRYTAKKYQRRNLIHLFNVKYREQGRIMKTLASVTLAVVISQIIGRVSRMVSKKGFSESFYTIFYNMFHITTCLNAALNFFIVALTSMEFRLAMKEMFFRSDVVSPF